MLNLANDERVREWLDNTPLHGRSSYQTLVMALRLFGAKIQEETALRCSEIAEHADTNWDAVQAIDREFLNTKAGVR